MNKYCYEELKRAAVETQTPEALRTLGAWFERYNIEAWNGEYFDADEFRLYPIYSGPDECGSFELIGYELK